MLERPQELPRVLVVDDNRLVRELARDALDQRAQVECVGSGPEALERLGRQATDLVISDLHMPGMSGLDLLQRVRVDHPGTDFVLVTSNASVESAVEALRLGASDYLRKPLEPQTFVSVVERIASRRRLQRENARLREALSVAESCRSLARCLDAGEIYAVGLDLLLHALDRNRGLAVFHRTLVPMTDGVAFRGFTGGEASRLRRVLGGEKPFDLEAHPEVGLVSEGPFHTALAEVGTTAGRVLAVPFRGGEREAGMLFIYEEGRPFDSDEVERANLIAGHAGLALQNAERYSRAQERAFVDDVTELYNARYLHQAVGHEIQRAQRTGRELTLLFLDLDRFKLVNDRFGHLVGSRALRRLSEVLRPCVRQVDTLARYGGEEVTILLVDTGAEAGMTVAERIRTTVAETLFEGGPGEPVRLSISIGVATYPRHASTRESLLDLADKAMYRAKSLGRDRVCSAAELDLPEPDADPSD